MRVVGIGPVPCDLVFVGERPGIQEARDGEPFTGRTSRDFNEHLLPSLGLRRDDVFLTNLEREYRAEGQEYSADERTRDHAEFRDELEAVTPRLVVAIGAEATRFMLGSDADLDEVHGILWRDPHHASRLVFPTAHIAAYTPELQARVQYDFAQLHHVLYDDDVQPRTLWDDPYPRPTYLEISDPRWIASLTGTTCIHVDTEGIGGRVWSVQFAVHPGTAYMIRATSRDTLLAFFRWVIRDHPRIVYHGSLHDFGIMRELLQSLGIPIDVLYDIEFDDTQIMAYLLQLEPIGLKPNCVRHCNMRMQDYTEVMGDAQILKAQDYLVGIFDKEQAEYAVRQHEAFELINRTPLCDAAGNPKRTKDGGIRYRKTRVLPTPPRTPLHKAADRVLRSARPYQLWLDQTEDIQVGGYNRMGGDIPLATLDDVDYATAKHYACRDADGTARVAPELSRRIDAMDLREVYRLELSTYPLIDRMMMIGMKPNLPHFADLSFRLQAEIEKLQYLVEKAVGREGFNANSGDQVAEHLFDRLGLPEYKRAKGSDRGSTNDKILEALEREFGVEYPEISLFRSYRETYKLKNTFVDRIPDFTHRWPHDGRIHATFRTTRVVTGRLAASDPNILAQPEHGAFAPLFKDGWEADDGHVLGAWDESQIELRVLAHLSQDPVLLAAYRDGVDLHAALAQRIFGVAPKDQDKSLHRLPAKAINFGIPMGMQAQGLTIELRKNGCMVTEDDAQRWLDDTNALYKGVVAYKSGMIAEARRTGRIRCLSGRIRYIGGIHSWDKALKAEAERFAFSTPIQEGAQWVMKQAEAELWSCLRALWRRGDWIEPLAQKHDALYLEMAEGLQQEVNELMHYCMVTSVQHNLSVPLDIEGEWGYCLGPKHDSKGNIRNDRGMEKFK